METECNEAKRESSKEVEKALRGRIKAEERLAETLEAHRVVEQRAAEWTAAEAAAGQRGMAVARMELEETFTELEHANEQLETAREGQRVAQAEAVAERERVQEAETSLAKAVARAERSEKEAQLLALSSEAAIEQGEWLQKQAALQTFQAHAHANKHLVVARAVEGWRAGMCAASLSFKFEARLAVLAEEASSGLELERKEAARRVREARERANQPIRELEILLARQEEKLEVAKSRDSFWKFLLGRVCLTVALQGSVGTWRAGMQRHTLAVGEARMVRERAVRRALDRVALRQAGSRMLRKGAILTLIHADSCSFNAISTPF